MSFAIVVGGAGALGSAIISEAKKHEFVSWETPKIFMFLHSLICA
jgi:hypothetical protein